MQHLFDHGHQRIAFIGTMDNADIKQRCASYRAALEARGQPVDPRLIVDTRGYREAHGRDAIEQLLASGLAFSAVVTAGDFNAFHRGGARRHRPPPSDDDPAGYHRRATGGYPGCQFAVDALCRKGLDNPTA
ncbi:MAG: hypothetical protein OHK0022_50160 [Roseiflexaceae bacterium]